MFCVIGANGFFGSYMKKHISLNCKNDFENLYFYHNVLKSDYNYFELSDISSHKRVVEILSEYTSINILFLACVHNPDIIKNNPSNAHYINCECYNSFLEELKKVDIKRFIYASSDVVYGQSINQKVFSEKDKLNPINIYGEQKKISEEITLAHGYNVARYSYLFEPSIAQGKTHFCDEIANKLNNNEKVYLFTDFIRQPLSYTLASEITYALFQKNSIPDILNICSDKPLSKYDIGLYLARLINANTELVVPCLSKELNVFNETRANEILLNNNLLKKILNADKIDFSFEVK